MYGNFSNSLENRNNYHNTKKLPKKLFYEHMNNETNLIFI